MRIDRIVVAAGLASLAACTSSGTTSESSPFAGTYTCVETSVITYTSPPNEPTATSTETVNLQLTSNADGTITAASNGDAGASCSFLFTPSGSTATLKGSQPCDAPGIAFTYTQGTSTVTGSTLDVSLSYSFSEANEAGTSADGGVPTAGTGTSTYTCTKS